MTSWTTRVRVKGKPDSGNIIKGSSTEGGELAVFLDFPNILASMAFLLKWRNADVYQTFHFLTFVSCAPANASFQEILVRERTFKLKLKIRDLGFEGADVLNTNVKIVTPASDPTNFSADSLILEEALRNR